MSLLPIDPLLASRMPWHPAETSAARFASDLLPSLVREGVTRLAVPHAFGGVGGSQRDLAKSVLEIARTDPFAGTVIASHVAVIQALLLGRNVVLREVYAPQLVDGDLFGQWPAAAIDSMVERNLASVQATDTGGGLRLNGALGQVPAAGAMRSVIVCPIQWRSDAPPGLALLDGDQGGLGAQQDASSRPSAQRCGLSLANVLFRPDELLDADGPRLVLGITARPLRDCLSLIFSDPCREITSAFHLLNR